MKPPQPSRLIALCVGVLLTAGAAGHTAAPPATTAGRAASMSPADQSMLALADDFLDHYYFPSGPTGATLAGVHLYDDRLEDFSRHEVDRQISALHDYEKRLSAVDGNTLSEPVRGDRELLLSGVRSNLLTLEVIRPWEKNPDLYSSGITGSAFSIMERAFAPPNERLRLLIAREKQMPAALQAAHANLRNAPKIYTQIAIEQLDGDVGYFEHDLPAAFAAADDPKLRQEFGSANAQVIAALKAYKSWLQKHLLPLSHGEFKLGAKTFSSKLLYDEMVDTPLDRLLQIGEQNLRQNQAEFARVAKQLEPDKSARQVLAELANNYPPPAKLLEAFRADFDGLIGFLNTHQIITVPEGSPPTLQETPPFMRATTFASMDTPGPFEKVATEAYFNVTLPDSSWDPKRIAGYMAQFNYPVISNVVVHEAYPGHYVQFLWMHHVDDRVRKLIGANSNAEGWAHYCEQMMLDEGYGQPGVGANSERDSLMLRLGQLQDALLRNARYMVAIKMHTGSMTTEQAIDYFVKEGYQSRETGEVETKRGTSDPTYLYYTLGKLQILKLRADLQLKQGGSFRLKDFHDAFMRQGFPPIKLVRRALMGDDSPTL
ncbi:MAG TPA: DUF885 domain-containing protein [Steroidobacteraceae bacterium]|jgi:uncharacterized protein (DUF885 family)|nr:DUF885 domain-containing protein [Steroidobacteraceae bacterium]